MNHSRFGIDLDSFRLVSRFTSIHFVSFHLDSFRLVSIVRFSFSVDLDSFRFHLIHFISFRFACSTIRSFVRSIGTWYSIPFPIVYPGNSTSFVDHCTPAVHSFLDILCACRTISHYFACWLFWHACRQDDTNSHIAGAVIATYYSSKTVSQIDCHIVVFFLYYFVCLNSILNFNF